MAPDAPSLLNAALADTPTAPAAAVAVPVPLLIVNPRSFRASRNQLAARAVALARTHGAQVLEADHPDPIAAGIDLAIQKGCRRIFVLAGDGTVHAIVEHLSERRHPPELLILGGGRSNLTAADLGGSGGLLGKLEAALLRDRQGQPFEIEDRPLLTIEQSPAPPRHGFFLAAALIDSALRHCHHWRETGRGGMRTGHQATGWSLVKLAIMGLLGRSPLPPNPELNILAENCGTLRGRTRVLIATTLLHRRGLFNPYADRGAGPLRLTAITESAAFWLRFPGILMGRFNARMVPERGYLSGRCEQIEVTGLSRYALDGEKFELDPARPVVIRSGPRLSFLRP
jgi:hypothetical protein